MFELIIPFIPTISYPNEELEKYADIELFKKDEQKFFSARELQAEKEANEFLYKHWNDVFYIEKINFGEDDEYWLDGAVIRIIFSNERI